MFKTFIQWIFVKCASDDCKENSKGTHCKLLLLDIPAYRNYLNVCNSTFSFGFIKSYTKCGTFLVVVIHIASTDTDTAY